MGHGVARIGDQSPSVQRRRNFLQIIYVGAAAGCDLFMIAAKQDQKIAACDSSYRGASSGSMPKHVQFFGLLVGTFFNGGFRRFFLQLFF
jgi:hypothetical protein